MTEEQKLKLAENNKQISSAEINQDILDTEREIAQMEREVQGFELIGDKLSMFKADGRRNGIEKRKKFIEDLQAILEVREKI